LQGEKEEEGSPRKFKERLNGLRKNFNYQKSRARAGIAENHPIRPKKEKKKEKKKKKKKKGEWVVSSGGDTLENLK